MAKSNNRQGVPENPLVARERLVQYHAGRILHNMGYEIGRPPQWDASKFISAAFKAAESFVADCERRLAQFGAVPSDGLPCIGEDDEQVKAEAFPVFPNVNV